MSLLQTFDCTCGHVVESILVVKVFNPDHQTVLLSYIPVKLECLSEAIRCQPLLHPFSILRNAPLSFLRIIALDKCFSTVPIRRTNQGLFTLDTSLLYNALKPAKCFPSSGLYRTSSERQTSSPCDTFSGHPSQVSKPLYSCRLFSANRIMRWPGKGGLVSPTCVRRP